MASEEGGRFSEGGVVDVSLIIIHCTEVIDSRRTPGSRDILEAIGVNTWQARSFVLYAYQV
jgi:hypothetical protein